MCASKEETKEKSQIVNQVINEAAGWSFCFRSLCPGREREKNVVASLVEFEAGFVSKQTTAFELRVERRGRFRCVDDD